MTDPDAELMSARCRSDDKCSSGKSFPPKLRTDVQPSITMTTPLSSSSCKRSCFEHYEISTIAENHMQTAFGGKPVNNNEHVLLHKGPDTEAPVEHAQVQDFRANSISGVTRRKRSILSEQQEELASSPRATKNAWYRFTSTLPVTC